MAAAVGLLWKQCCVGIAGDVLWKHGQGNHVCMCGTQGEMVSILGAWMRVPTACVNRPAGPDSH